MPGVTPGMWEHHGETTAVWPGRNWPLGATWATEATNFAVYAPDAPRRLAVPVRRRATPRRGIELTEHIARHLARRACPDLRAGQRYGFRADGPWDPERGLRFNPAKLLLDPYARAVAGDLTVRPGDLRLRRGPTRELRSDRGLRAVPRRAASSSTPTFDWGATTRRCAAAGATP